LSLESKEHPKSPIVLIVLGMAGSGKTTFVQVNFSVITKKHNRD